MHAKDTLKKTFQIDLENTPYLISEDDTALQPHLDVKEYKSEGKQKIELYGFENVVEINSFKDLKNAFT